MATLKRLKRGEVDLRLEKVVASKQLRLAIETEEERITRLEAFLKSWLTTVLPINSCIAIDRLMIELLDFHIPFLSFTNAGFKGYGKNLLNRRLRITQLP